MHAEQRQEETRVQLGGTAQEGKQTWWRQQRWKREVKTEVQLAVDAAGKLNGAPPTTQPQRARVSQAEDQR